MTNDQGQEADKQSEEVIRIPRGEHSVGIAVMACALVCGPGGQFFNRQPKKGIACWVVHLAFGWTGAYLGLTALQHNLLYFLPPAALQLFFMVDAAVIAGRLFRGEPVRPWQFF